jgi:hypothetical protein
MNVGEKGHPSHVSDPLRELGWRFANPADAIQHQRLHFLHP